MYRIFVYIYRLSLFGTAHAHAPYLWGNVARKENLCAPIKSCRAPSPPAHKHGGLQGGTFGDSSKNIRASGIFSCFARISTGRGGARSAQVPAEERISDEAE